MSARSLKVAPKIYLTPDSRQLSSIQSMSFTESVISGIIGSIFTAHLIPVSLNLFIILKIADAEGVPGSTTLLMGSLQVVIDQVIKQFSLYC
jgi:hypothetical protein